jgi:hypothetical protein
VTEFTTKDSGEHEQYDSGMRRDSQNGRPRFDLIRTKRQPYEEQMIYRYAMLLARGAEKYSERNWEEGDSEVELDRAKASLLRHTEQLIAGETDEDHAAAVWFNTQAIEYFRWRIAQKEGINDLAEPTGPPATPTDRIKAEANANLSQLLASSAPLSALPKQRVDDWLKTYGIELIEGSLGDPYEKIHEVEFCVRLKTGATKLEKSGVANALDIQ